jgi:hypothetical protein
VAYRHGLRAQELCDLEWSQIDWKAATVGATSRSLALACILLPPVELIVLTNNFRSINPVKSGKIESLLGPGLSVYCALLAGGCGRALNGGAASGRGCGLWRARTRPSGVEAARTPKLGWPSRA